MGAVACIAPDMVHEALGHGTASWIAGDRILSLSTVAIQSAAPSRFDAAAHVRSQPGTARPVPFSFYWLALGLALSAVFIGVLGPGIRF
jgi:hypothetical protein